jgi:hypothetical protein
MNLKLIVTMACASVIFAGCATFQNAMVLESVGPGPAATASPGDANGTLVVYSAFDASPDFNRPDPSRRVYSNYQIFAGDRLLQFVHNSSGSILQRPQRVGLPPGAYRVVAQANGYGLVTVPVTILAGRDTIVHLEGGVKWPDQFGPGQVNAVRLPDGEIVGWKSALASAQN